MARTKKAWDGRSKVVLALFIGGGSELVSAPSSVAEMMNADQRENRAASNFCINAAITFLDASELAGKQPPPCSDYRCSCYVTSCKRLKAVVNLLPRHNARIPIFHSFF